jgi:AraC-like DNA-binding protein
MAQNDLAVVGIDVAWSFAEVAERVGYSSQSTFSVAFTRHVGLPPRQYARERTEPTTLATSTRRGRQARH